MHPQPLTSLRARAALGAGLLIALCSGCYEPHGPAPEPPRPSSAPLPSVASLSPAAAEPGAAVSVQGANFREGMRIHLGGTEAPLQGRTDTTAVFVVPEPLSGPVTLRVENADGTADEVPRAFTVLRGHPAEPAVDGVSYPLFPPGGGTPFLVHGEGFRQGAVVRVGGVEAADVRVVHGGLLSGVYPAALGPPGPRSLSVTNPSGRFVLEADAVSCVDPGADGCLFLGRVLTERRVLLPEGLSGGLGRAACPWVRVEIVDASGAVSASTHADEQGYFAAVAPAAGSAVRVRAVSAVQVPPSPVENVRVSTDPSTGTLYGVESQPFLPPAGGAVQVSFVVPAEEPLRPSGAYHIARLTALCARFVHEHTGEVLPPVDVYWYSGNAAAQMTSYFVVADGSPAIHLLGGVADYVDRSDTDEYDEGVVAHEFGHFVQHALSTDASPGGPHGGEMIVPNLAFSEGFADWFSCAALGRTAYRDTLGHGAYGSMRMAFEPEHVWWQVPVVSGEGSEASVMEVLWDLSDGGADLPDADGDGLVLGPGPLLEALRGFDPLRDFVSIQTFFREITGQGHVSNEALSSLLRRPEEQNMAHPSPAGRVFPQPLEGEARDFVDAVNPYRPAEPDWRFWLAAARGNPANPVNGYNARRYFSFSVDRSRTVRLRLEIEGSGREPENLDLYLLDAGHGELASSAGDGPVEEIAHTCHPGRTYVAEVRAFRQYGYGVVRASKAAFRLRMEEP